MTFSPRTVMLAALAVVAWAGAPTAVVAATPVDASALVQDADGEEGVDEQATEEAAGDAFCPEDPDLDAFDEELDASEVGLEFDEDVPEEEVADEVDDGALDFCSEGPFAPLHPSRLSLITALKRGSFDPGAINVTVPGTIVRELRLAPGSVTPRAVRRYRAATLGGARRIVTTDGFLDLPVTLNATGRKALRAAGRELRVSVATTLRLASGEKRTRTQVVVLSRGRR